MKTLYKLPDVPQDTPLKDQLLAAGFKWWEGRQGVGASWEVLIEKNGKDAPRVQAFISSHKLKLLDPMGKEAVVDTTPRFEF